MRVGSRFVLTTGQDVHAATLEDYQAGQREWRWTVQGALRHGDLLALYIANPLRSFAWIGRALSDAERPPGSTGQFTAWLELVPLGSPLALDEARLDPVLSASKVLRGGLQGGSRRVSEDVWAALVALVTRRNPELVGVLEDWLAHAPEPITDSSAFEWGRNGPQADYPYRRERLLQEDLLKHLVAADTLRPATAGDGIDLPALEARLGGVGRADIVLVDEAARQRLVVLETKLYAHDPRGLEQLKRYRAWLAERHPDWEIELILAAQEISEDVRRAAWHDEVACLQVRWGRDDDELWSDEELVVFDYLNDGTEPPADGDQEAERTREAVSRLSAASRAVPLEALGRAQAPDEPGVLALWLASKEREVLDELGLPDTPSAPLQILSCTSLAAEAEALGSAELLLPPTLALHLSMATETLPWDMGSDPIGKAAHVEWARTRLAATWVPTQGIPASRIALRASHALRPVFAGYWRLTVHELSERFTLETAVGVDAMRWATAWESFVLRELAEHLDGAREGAILVETDEGLEPVGARDLDGSAARGQDEAILRTPTHEDARQALLRFAGAAKGEGYIPSLPSPEVIRELSHLECLAVLMGFEVRSVPIVLAHENDATLRMPPGPPRRHLVLPGEPDRPTNTAASVWLLDDGSRVVRFDREPSKI